MEKIELAAVLNRAADYLDAHGLRSGSWGSPGGPACMNAALAIALDRHPDALGRMCFFNPRANPTTDAVGAVILESGLLEILPVPQAEPGSVRRVRPPGIGARRAVLELARWSDVPGRTATAAAGALRTQAVAMLRAHRPVPTSRQPVLAVAEAVLVPA
jgi:hypothetical protein